MPRRTGWWAVLQSPHTLSRLNRAEAATNVRYQQCSSSNSIRPQAEIRGVSGACIGLKSTKVRIPWVLTLLNDFGAIENSCWNLSHSHPFHIPFLITLHLLPKGHIQGILLQKAGTDTHAPRTSLWRWMGMSTLPPQCLQDQTLYNLKAVFEWGFCLLCVLRSTSNSRSVSHKEQ